MKLLIEQSDVKEVQRVLHDYYGVILTDAEAKGIIEENSSLAAELYECKGRLDTQARDMLSDILLKYVLGDKSSLTWPIYGDSAEYTNKFNETFEKAAKEKGIALINNWSEF